MVYKNGYKNIDILSVFNEKWKGGCIMYGITILINFDKNIFLQRKIM